MARRYTWCIPCLAVLLATAPAGGLGVRPVRLEHLQERGAALREPILPSQFRGHWSESLNLCAEKPVKENQVWITGNSLNGYEVSGKLTRVVVKNALRAVVTMKSEGDGIVFVSKKGLSLSTKRNALDIRDADDTYSIRFYRCPAADVAAPGSQDRQILAGKAFNDLAARTDAACPSREVRAITPGDLDYVESDFEDRLSPAVRRRLDLVNPAARRCEGYNGLACGTTATLEAFGRIDLMAEFTSYICSHLSPKMTVTVRHRREAAPPTRP